MRLTKQLCDVLKNWNPDGRYLYSSNVSVYGFAGEDMRAPIVALTVG